MLHWRLTAALFVRLPDCPAARPRWRMADAAKREAKGCEDAGEADVDIGPGLSALAAKRRWRCSPKRTHAAPKATRPGNGQWGSANLACLKRTGFTTDRPMPYQTRFRHRGCWVWRMPDTTLAGIPRSHAGGSTARSCDQAPGMYPYVLSNT